MPNPDPNPMQRLAQYTQPGKAGGVVIDIEAMMVDLSTVAKASGRSFDELAQALKEVFDEVEVEVRTPSNIVPIV